MQNYSELAILHIEDDPMMTIIVRRALEGMQFGGKLFTAKSLDEATKLLRQKVLDKQHLNLILSDMQLPDGTGLDILRSIKNDSYWRLTPVIILSSESEANWIDAAYEAGAACYFPKENTIAALKSLYFCWLENAYWPSQSSVDPLQAAIARSVFIRAQVSELYLSVSRIAKEAADISFWLDRALNEGNLSNLLAFLKPLVQEKEAPQGLVERFTIMQDKVQTSLDAVQNRVNTDDSLHLSELYSCVMDLYSALNAQTILELFNYIFLVSPPTLDMFKKNAIAQLSAIAQYITQKAKDPKLMEQARSMIELSEKLRA